MGSWRLPSDSVERAISNDVIDRGDHPPDSGAVVEAIYGIRIVFRKGTPVTFADLCVQALP